MENSIESLKHTFKKHRNRTIVAAIICILIFTIVMTGGCFALSRLSRESLTLRGEVWANESAEEFDRHLTIGANSIRLAAINVERMLKNNAGADEILSYLTIQSEDIIASMDSSYTSLYGYIDGNYLDGSGWVPAADYVPTERPWYVETLEMQQDVAYIRPYLDSKTGEIIMTVTALLSDKKSVIALDLSLGDLQSTNEAIAAKIAGSKSMVLDSECYVVSHSDTSELGKNYISESGTLGAEIAQKVWAEHDFDFQTKIGNTLYIVYATQIEGGWYSIAAINTDGFYWPIIITSASSLLATIIAVVVLWAVLVGKIRRKANQTSRSKDKGKE